MAKQPIQPIPSGSARQQYEDLLALYATGSNIFDYDGMSDKDQDTVIREYFGYWIASLKEKKENQDRNIIYKNEVIGYKYDQLNEELPKLGFACDNSLDDYELLFNYPEVFGVDYIKHAQYHYNESNGDLYYFHSLCLKYADLIGLNKLTLTVTTGSKIEPKEL